MTMAVEQRGALRGRTPFSAGRGNHGGHHHHWVDRGAASMKVSAAAPPHLTEQSAGDRYRTAFTAWECCPAGYGRGGEHPPPPRAAAAATGTADRVSRTPRSNALNVTRAPGNGGAWTKMPLNTVPAVDNAALS